MVFAHKELKGRGGTVGLESSDFDLVAVDVDSHGVGSHAYHPREGRVRIDKATEIILKVVAHHYHRSDVLSSAIAVRLSISAIPARALLRLAWALLFLTEPLKEPIEEGEDRV